MQSEINFITSIQRTATALLQALKTGLKRLVKFINLAWNNIFYVTNAIVNIVVELAQRTLKTIGKLILGIPFLALGAFKASAIIIKGVGLSIGALFFETGVSTAVSGVAQSIFILEETVADALDALRDAVRNYFHIVFPSLFSAMNKPTTNSFNYNELETESDLNPHSNYILPETHAIGNAMRYINREVIASAGNKMLHNYKSLKARQKQPRVTQDQTNKSFRRRNSNRQDTV